MSATVTNGHDLYNFVDILTLIPLNIFILLVSRTTYKYCYSIYFPIDIYVYCLVGTPLLFTFFL